MPKTIEKCAECGLRTDFCKRGVIKKYRRRIKRKIDFKKFKYVYCISYNPTPKFDVFGKLKTKAKRIKNQNFKNINN
ncbi:hypothetical protein BpHYR1_018807 [Brachionus plicatilis]|uniref:Uncharacterized protein n=1 Tax=Brachionus plicatilis TaxID=10195 RepID=A0A3M7SVA3_BRAPC|nr:hypothetical protein BpHYR1_018807 [Brachionus plicatilis]